MFSVFTKKSDNLHIIINMINIESVMMIEKNETTIIMIGGNRYIVKEVGEQLFQKLKCELGWR